MVALQTKPTKQARSEHRIEVRRPSFDFDSVDERFWYDDNAILTAVISCLSATFPPGEKEFVRSVMLHRDKITDETLRQQMRDFAGQEGQHAFQHQRANEWLDEKGFGASEIVERVEARIEARVGDAPPIVRLALTVSFEHITAILAHYLLTHPEMIEAMPPTMAELFSWHAVEEIEHKAVAFDVFEAVGGDKRMLRTTFLIATGFFLFHQIGHAGRALKNMGYSPTARDVTGAAKFFFGRRGIVRGIGKSYLDFLRSDFHPWDHDDRDLIDAWKTRQAAN